MSKKIFFILIIAGLCFGQNGKSIHDSKFAIGLIGGLNYAVYVDKWDGGGQTHSISTASKCRNIFKK